MGTLVYRASCPACGAEWPRLVIEGAERPAGEAAALVACGECFGLVGASVRLTAAEIEQYRRNIMKTLQKMYQGYSKALMRLEERKRGLMGEVRRGNTAVIEELKGLEARIAAMKPPDTRHLDARVKELAGTAREAPSAPAEVRCAECGAVAAVHRETHRGFEVPCPRCRTRLEVKLDRSGGAASHDASDDA